MDGGSLDFGDLQVKIALLYEALRFMKAETYKLQTETHRLRVSQHRIQFLKWYYLLSLASSAIQFTSQVLPPSAENACSK